jgi:hypothetical protein
MLVRPRAWVAAAATALILACSRAPAATGERVDAALGPCLLLQVGEVGHCGTVAVFEDRARGAGSRSASSCCAPARPPPRPTRSCS